MAQHTKLHHQDQTEPSTPQRAQELDLKRANLHRQTMPTARSGSRGNNAGDRWCVDSNVFTTQKVVDGENRTSKEHHDLDLDAQFCAASLAARARADEQAASVVSPASIMPVRTTLLLSSKSALSLGSFFSFF